MMGCITFSIVAIVAWCIIGIYGDQNRCASLSGVWQDTVRGRTLLLQHSPIDGKITGYYTHGLTLPWSSTAGTTPLGEREPVGDGYNTAEVTGFAPASYSNTTFAFTVLYTDGSLVVSWTAQCIVCDGAEMLQATWLSQRTANGCSDQWQSTLVGQMSFLLISRDQRVMRATARRAARIISLSQRPSQTGRATNRPNPVCSIYGLWQNELGSGMNITYTQGSHFEGVYTTAVERFNGSSGGFVAPVYGQSSVTGTGNAFAFYVLWKNGSSTTEWAGTCMPCGDQKSELLTTTWVLRKAIDKCGDNWHSSLVGTDVFTRYDISRRGGRPPRASD